MAVSIEGIDYSDARPGGAYLASHGKHFAVRYLYPPVTGGKGLSQAEVNNLHAYGIQIAVVFEGAAGAATNGRSQGIKDAKLAQALLTKLSLSHTLPVYFAVDFDATPSEQAAIDSYLNGAASVIGHHRVGVYGSYYVIKRCQANKSASWFWQTYAWSGGNVASGIHLLQYSNGQWAGSVDFTRALQADYGQHATVIPAPAPAPKPVPAPAPTPPPIPAPIPPTETGAEPERTPVYFKGDTTTEVYYLNRATGKKRHVPAAEWAAVNLGQSIIIIAQAEADAIPAG